MSSPRKPTINSRAIFARSAAGSVEGDGDAVAAGVAVAVGEGPTVSALDDGELDGAPDEGLGVGVSWTPQAARPAAIEPAAIAWSSARREMGRSLVTDPR
jgi:hypothetical protein